MDYLEWIERVLHAAAIAVEHDRGARPIGVSIWEVAKALDTGVDPTSPDFHQSDQRPAIIEAVGDLGQLSLAEVTGDHMRIKLTDEGRRGTSASLRPSWPRLFGQIRLDAETRSFLAAAVSQSELRGERFAKMRRTTAQEVFERLGWPWDIAHAFALTQSLENKSCLTRGRRWAARSTCASRTSASSWARKVSRPATSNSWVNSSLTGR